MAELKRGDRVKRTGSQKDYCTGRVGRVVSLRSDGRAQVLWHTQPDGKPIRKPINTWVKLTDLEIMVPDDS